MSLADRTIGGFPIAIGTSLALETLFEPRLPPYDPERTIPEKGDIRHYQTAWFNVATLFRNVVGAVTKEQFKAASIRDLVEALEHECDVIQSIFEQEGQNACKPFFYIAEYPQLERHRKQNLVDMREERTLDQLAYKTAWLDVVKALKKYSTKSWWQSVEDAVVPPQRTRSLIVTHVPLDLSQYGKFDRLVLLESHTGKLKPRTLWYTKYHELGRETLHTLPFHKPLLYLFGDHTQIRPTAPSLRRMIVEISRNRQWTPMTQWMTVRMHLELDFPDKDFLARLFKTV